MQLKKKKQNSVSRIGKQILWLIILFFLAFLFFTLGGNLLSNYYNNLERKEIVNEPKTSLQTVVDKVSEIIVAKPELDKKLYDQKNLYLAHKLGKPSEKILKDLANELGTSTESISKILDTAIYDKQNKIPWPVETVYPAYGALLPFHRIVAFYGNLLSNKMGALGEYPEDEMLAKLSAEARNWEVADPEIPVLPALHYIVETAQGSAGADGKYRLQMSDSEVDKILAMAEKIGAIVFLDFQIGLSTLEAELPVYEKYLSLPQVHLGLDPEFAMAKSGSKPGVAVGTFDAEEINFAINYLSQLVQKNSLTPKILVIHRFTQNGLTNYQNIKPTPEVQVVIDMDGWGIPEQKIATYKNFIYPEPVQFTGFKLFYKNDTVGPAYKPLDSRLLTPKEILNLTPSPIYIQYQ
jgi:hypothetical protein